MSKAFSVLNDNSRIIDCCQPASAEISGNTKTHWLVSEMMFRIKKRKRLEKEA